MVEIGHSLLRVWRYSPSGSLDSAFGSSGYATISISNIFAGNSGVTTQADGKVVVATAAIDPATSQRRGMVVRFNSDGSLDSGFGSGGISTIAPAGYAGTQRATDVVVLSDGRIAVSGNQVSDKNRVVAARLLPNGAPDPSFGIGGSSVFEFAQDAFGRKLAVQPDGKMVIAGTTFDPSGAFETSLERVNADGSLDLAFGSNGQATFKGEFGQLANNVALQGNGKILVATQTMLKEDLSEAAASITRFASNGQVDSAFGSGGVAAMAPAGTTWGNTTAVRQSRAGMIASRADVFDPSSGSSVSYGVHLLEGSGSGCN
jgi:uncharacterized delta-60 repeat protein